MKKPELKARVTLTLTDIKTGRVVKRQSFCSRSYVLAMLDLLYVQEAQVTQSIIDTNNSAQNCAPHAQNFRANSGADNAAYGVVIGSGSNPVTIADYNLQTLIDSDGVAGKMVYGETLFTAPATSGSTRSFTIYRTMSNNSGASQTVRECGIRVIGTSGTKTFLVVRDLISGGQVVLNGQALTITYTIGVTV